MAEHYTRDELDDALAGLRRLWLTAIERGSPIRDDELDQLGEQHPMFAAARLSLDLDRAGGWS